MYAEKYVEKFHSSYEPEPNSGCWLWVGSLNENRGKYGRFFVGRKSIRAHRASYLIATGKCPADRFVCHKCDTPQCVNPDHLFLGEPKDNTWDMIKKGRAKSVRGAAHGKAKLSADDVLTIRNLLANGAVQRKVAALYSVSPALICIINKRKKWIHI